ncbi:hypothetical protein [Azospirillum soli]|uniref:hypothetical protein n=1 Tax=Azospirillum soli TaxID=1304799 RepID=UPI001AEA804E|nr:hypothetical protein [Azospirillum soli]MBP2312051.1 hypothetical protein [Azospirillum soli]
MSLRALVIAAVAALSLSACTSTSPSEFLAGAFGSWCRTSSNCDDHTRRQP